MYRVILLIMGFSYAKANMDGFIVGGKEVSIRMWPFITFIQAILPDRKSAACGGSLLSSQTVLTAAHCLDDITQQRMLDVQYTIFMGHSSFKMSTMTRRVKDYETHQDYDPQNEDVRADIGVMFLFSPVNFIANVQKVILMKKKFNYRRDKYLIVAGWGRTDTGEEARISSKLKDVKLKTISQNECSERLPFVENIDKVICAAASHEYAYSGDSGGPMLTRDGRLQLGIVSFRSEDTEITLFTSVPEYYNWINNTNFKLYKKFCVNDVA